MAVWGSLGSSSGFGSTPRPPAFNSMTQPKATGSPFSAQPQGYQPRGAPESISLEDYVPESVTGEMGGIGGALDTAMRFPAYTTGRPLAFADTLAQQTGLIPEDRGLLDPLVEGIRGIPLVGGALSSAGDLTMNAFDFTFSAGNLVAQPINTHLAMLWDSTKDNAEDESIGLWDEIQAVLRGKGDLFQLLDPNDTITKAELRAVYNNIGWTDKDLSDIETGKKGWMDFHDKGLTFGSEPQPIVDFLGRAIGDPMNFIFGLGALSKAGMVFRAGTRVTSGAARGVKAGLAGEAVGAAVRGSTKTLAERTMSKAMQTRATGIYAQRRAKYLFTHKALPQAEGVKKMSQGSILGVTQSAAGKFIRGYRNVAYGSTGLQIGLNSIDQLMNGDSEPDDGWMGNVFDFARRWGDHKPLSKNDLFTMYMIMKVPGRTIASNATKPLKNAINKRRSFAHERDFVEMLAPDFVEGGVKVGLGSSIVKPVTASVAAKSYKAAREYVVSQLGGENQFQAAMNHVLRAELHKKNFLEGTPSLPNIFHVTSLFESGSIVDRYSKIMDGFVRDALQEGGLKTRDLQAAVRDFTATRGGVLDDVTRGVEQQTFRPDDFFHAWSAWEPLADATSRAFDNGVAVRPGITADLVTTDGIEWLLARIDVLKAGKTIKGEDLLDILRSEPAVFNFPGGQEFARVLTRDGMTGTYQVDRVRKWLNEVKLDHALPRHEYVATYEQWEGLSKASERMNLFVNSRHVTDGKLPDDVNPDLADASTATIHAGDGDAVMASQAELGGAGMGVIRHMRNTTEGQAFRYNMTAGLRIAGYGIRSSVDSVFLIGGRHGASGMATPGLLLRMNPHRPPQDALDVIAMGLQRSSGRRGTAVIRGKTETEAAGWSQNADELTYHVGNRTESQWDDLINKLNDEWGDRITINDTTGTVRILVPDGQTRGITKRLERADKILGGNAVKDRVAYRDVVKGKADAVRGSDYVLLKDQIAIAKGNKRYHIANDYIELGVGGYPGASAQRGGKGPGKPTRTPDGSQYSVGADGATQYSQPTHWESDNGGGVRGSSSEHLVHGLDGAITAERWTDKIRTAGVLDTPHGARFNLAAGDRVYATGKPGSATYGRGGVIVRDTGEVIPWRQPGPGPSPADWGSVLAESSREGTWARFLDKPGPGGQSAIDVLAEHGYVPVVRGRVTTGSIGDDLDVVVYMAFDPDNLHGMALGKRLWKDVRASHDSLILKSQAARSQIEGYVISLHPERMKRATVAAENNRLLAKQRQIAEKEQAIAAKKAELNEKDYERVRPKGRGTAPAEDYLYHGTGRTSGSGIQMSGHIREGLADKPNWTADIERSKTFQIKHLTTGEGGRIYRARASKVGGVDKGEGFRKGGRVDLEHLEVSFDDGLTWHKASDMAAGQWQTDRYSGVTESIPVASLDGIPAGNALGKTDVNELAASLKERGFDEPLILGYSKDGRTVRVDEGNHRLAAARLAGLENVPVRVVRLDRKMRKPAGKTVRGIEPDANGHVPGDLRPSQIGVGTVVDDGVRQVARDTMANKGATVNARTLEPWTGGGYSVATVKGTVEHLPLSATEEEIAAAIQRVRDNYPDAEQVGTWLNDDASLGLVGYHIDPATIRMSRRDAELLAQRTDQIAIFDMTSYENIVTPTIPINAPFTKSSSYRKLMAERDALIADTSTTAAQARQAAADIETINPGVVTFVEGAERQVADFRVRLDESIEGNLDSLPPEQIEKILLLEADMRLTGTYVDRKGMLVDAANYRLKRLPNQATPYRGVQVESEAYRAITGGRIAAEDGWRTYTTSKIAQAQQLMFGRVYAVELQSQFRQEMYNEMLAKGARPGEVNRFLKALQAEWEAQFSIGGARLFRAVDMMPPGAINKLARGQRKDSLLFNKGFEGEWVHTTDVADLMQRASSRTFRNLATKYPAQDGRGHLGKLIETFYGKAEGRGGTASKIARRGAYSGTVGYTVLRFILDPRWYLMNAFEADLLGMARWGSKVRGVMGGKARNTGILGHMKGTDPSVPRDMFVERMSARRKDASLLSVDEILHANASASGWMDPRNLYGYVAKAAEMERPVITGKLFQQMIDEGSPVIKDLRARHGDNQAAWFDEIDELLYSIDKKGAKRTVLDNELAQIMKNDPVNGAVYEEFLTRLWQNQRQMFKDVTHTFHGNVNRANSERLLNSPLLWWPLSYQLKTGKWLIDVMTKGFAGSKSELAGTAVLGKLLANHGWAMENNDDYRNEMDSHPALFRAMSMMLPITPFDFGVFMARWTRYAGSWTGAQLGLWDQDESYPQDPRNFLERGMALGPIYSWDILNDVWREFERQGSSGDKFKSQSKFKK